MAASTVHEVSRVVSYLQETLKYKKGNAEAVVRKSSVKKVFLEISQNLQ